MRSRYASELRQLLPAGIEPDARGRSGGGSVEAQFGGMRGALQRFVSVGAQAAPGVRRLAGLIPRMRAQLRHEAGTTLRNRALERGRGRHLWGGQKQ